MANDVLQKAGAKIIIGDSDCNPTAGVGLTGVEDTDFTFLNFLTATLGQSVKFSFSTPWGRRWRVVSGLEFIAAPTAGLTVDFYIGYSDSATAANENPGNLSGAAGAYQGYGGDAASGIEALLQLYYIGSLICTADIAIQVAEIGIITPLADNACLVIHNQSGQTIADIDGVETSVQIIEIIDEIQ